MLPFIRMHFQGKRLCRKLRRSLIDNDEGWVVRTNNTAPTCVEYVEGGDASKVIFSITIVPSLGSCVCRGCDKVQVRVNGVLVWTPHLASKILGNAVRAFVLDYANKELNRVL